MAVIVAIVVKNDATALAESGYPVGGSSPRAWFWGTMLMLLIVLPVYLYMRNDAVKARERDGVSPSPRRAGGAARPALQSSSGSTARYEDLASLGDLHDKGILTDIEFEIEKRKVLG